KDDKKEPDSHQETRSPNKDDKKEPDSHQETRIPNKDDLQYHSKDSAYTKYMQSDIEGILRSAHFFKVLLQYPLYGHIRNDFSSPIMDEVCS
ncbi:hypothetical protein, partial [Cytobacillus horneckiae]|uniref:hypothetical protein n=1 Tax=Cytobacillus horneckiae TaxID=549687 RepID=UPI003D1B65E2